ncbi:SLAP domain-containing protein [Lysinibacillus sp. SGAir0095]|uniref:SLAP domain-containing protein n=1 Tax=Lysinibacillus sp. SGAir0095 TaxID=2070463 RepID=UPI0010CD5B08|nr:SLAP domain-containing protein [Lysinibacillus sp. SGAir0095]QCR31201.1 SLAP domain-containing protein [Lysinibacillus sp. SGAir0095]
MQQLQFEASWDKALAAKDRLNIEKIFDETKHQDYSGVLCTPIREAINHEEALLVTVLVHNFTDDPLRINNTRLLYSIHGEAIADEVFTLPALTIPPKMSMPWTFIFTKGSYKPQSSFKDGQLEIL